MTTKLPIVPYRIIEDSENNMAHPQPIQLDAQRIDSPTPTTGYRQHPQMRRLESYGRPLTPEELPGMAPHAGYYGHNPAGQMANATHVEVNNNGQYYRPVKEELTLSFAKTIGNFFAWPFRLVGRFIESLVVGAAGVLKTILLMIIAPMVLLSGYSYYQDNKERPATEMAADLGTQGVHLVGAMLGGIWDGIFGDDEEAPAATDKK